MAAVTDTERMVDLLTYANRAKVADALRVSRASVSRWAKGKDVTPYRVRQVEQLLRPERPAAGVPTWAVRLLEGMFAVERRSGITGGELAEAEAQVAAYLAVALQEQPEPDNADAPAGARASASHQAPRR